MNINLLSLLIITILNINLIWAESNPNNNNNSNNKYNSLTKKEWQDRLSPSLYRICRQKGTEIAYSGQYHDNNQSGTYYCACCASDNKSKLDLHPVYSSKNKYDSKTGWPSFWKPISSKNIKIQKDKSFLARLSGATNEVVCARCGSHLGHIFEDGPADKTGLRHCINSLALKFISDEDNSPTKIKQISKYAIFAMGCFWCAESDFESLPGVIEVESGYIGGKIANPTYKKHPGYREAIRIEYNPKIISYNKLLEKFWRNIDPFDDKGQFCDKGDSYKAAVYYISQNQKKLAEQSKLKTAEILNKGIVTEILPATKFYLAEKYHQNYYKENPLRYKFYRYRCGRDSKLMQIWKKQK